MLTLDRDPVRLQPEDPYETIGILSYGRGLFARPIVKGSETSYSTYYRVRRGQFVYSKLFAWEGALAVVDERFHGLYVSQEFPTFAIDTQIALPAYLALLCSWPETWARVRIGETGMGGRRKRVHADRLLDVLLPFPSLPEQRRIVDLVEAVDTCRHAAEAVHRAGQVTMTRLLNDQYDALIGHSEPIERLLCHVIGGAWGDPEGERECRVLALGPSVFAGDPLLVHRDHGTARSLSTSRAAVRTLRRGDIVLERSGGAAEQPVGRVVHAPDDMPDVVPSDFMRLLRVDPEQAEFGFVFWVLWLRYQNGDTRPFQKKTTNIRNLDIPAYLATCIKVPCRKDQAQFVSLAVTLAEMRKATADYVGQMTLVRSALLASLLSGEHQISDLYDALLESA